MSFLDIEIDVISIENIVSAATSGPILKCEFPQFSDIDSIQNITLILSCEENKPFGFFTFPKDENYKEVVELNLCMLKGVLPTACIAENKLKAECIADAFRKLILKMKKEYIQWKTI